MPLPIRLVCVPQGSEYKAVCQGLSQTETPPPVLPIPIGSGPLTRSLAQLQRTGTITSDQHPQILLMGLCGSLIPRYAVGDIVCYQGCVYATNPSTKLLPCNLALTTLIDHRLQGISQVRALTSDRLVCSAVEKHQLSQKYDAEVVDMEGYAALETLNQLGAAVAMLRVVSDDCSHDLPDLNAALSPEGALLPLPLAIGLLRQPLAAAQLIRGSLRGLRVLREVTRRLFTDTDVAN